MNADAVHRALDIVVAGVALAALAPILLAIAVAIRLTSPGPALFRQERLGFDRHPFTLLKFRTMRHGADDGVHRAYVSAMLAGGDVARTDGLYKLDADPRVTRIGSFLRRASLDELPQLWNVLRGDMALVGPRPALRWEAELYAPAHAERFRVKPGLTGLWQVSGRNRLTMAQALNLDVEYVRRRSVGLDVAILLRTVPVVLWRRDSR